MDISACDVLRDPVRFVLDVSDIATRTTVSWQEQTTDDEGLPAPTERTVATIDPDREIEYGTRNISVQSMLTTATDAQTCSQTRLLARSIGTWRLDGLLVADADFQVPDQQAAQILMALLDGVKRGGLLLRVTELPGWSPLGETANVYLEGGQYGFSGGGWELALTVSRTTGQGTSAAWDELGASWQWDQWQPALTWDELRGINGPLTQRKAPQWAEQEAGCHIPPAPIRSWMAIMP